MNSEHHLSLSRNRSNAANLAATGPSTSSRSSDPTPVIDLTMSDEDEITILRTTSNPHKRKELERTISSEGRKRVRRERSYPPPPAAASSSRRSQSTVNTALAETDSRRSSSTLTLSRVPRRATPANDVIYVDSEDDEEKLASLLQNTSVNSHQLDPDLLDALAIRQAMKTQSLAVPAALERTRADVDRFFRQPPVVDEDDEWDDAQAEFVKPEVTAPIDVCRLSTEAVEYPPDDRPPHEFHHVTVCLATIRRDRSFNYVKTLEDFGRQPRLLTSGARCRKLELFQRSQRSIPGQPWPRRAGFQLTGRFTGPKPPPPPAGLYSN